MRSVPLNGTQDPHHSLHTSLNNNISHGVHAQEPAVEAVHLRIHAKVRYGVFARATFFWFHRPRTPLFDSIRVITYTNVFANCSVDHVYCIHDNFHPCC